MQETLLLPPFSANLLESPPACARLYRSDFLRSSGYFRESSALARRSHARPAHQYTVYFRYPFVQMLSKTVIYQIFFRNIVHKLLSTGRLKRQISLFHIHYHHAADPAYIKTYIFPCSPRYRKRAASNRSSLPAPAVQPFLPALPE